MVDELVEFTIEVSNTGPGDADEVVVTDEISGDMEIPEGMAAFTTAGYYDPTSGNWEIGALSAGQSETMNLPARIITRPQPVCVINTAQAFAAGDLEESDNLDRVALRRPGIERCVDLRLKMEYWRQLEHYCSGTGSVQYAVEVGNAGPDAANNVVLEISDTLDQKPGYRIDPAENCEEMRCTWATLDAGASQVVRITTDTFDMLTNTAQVFKLVLASDQEDYAPEDNRLTEERTIVAVSQDCPPPGVGGAGWDLSGVGAGCFIATATYGSELHPYVQTLREFRDDVLLKFGWGRSMVELYYRHSPDLACYIAERDGLRMLTRGILTPIVFVIAYPWQAGLLLIAISAMVFALLRSRRVRRD